MRTPVVLFLFVCVSACVAAALAAPSATTPATTPATPTPAPATPAAATTKPSPCFAAVVGTWRNERGSELRIDSVDVECRVKGAFRSVVGRVDTDVFYAVAGVARGDVVALTVDFRGSVAAWVGQLDGPTLRTQWHVVRDIPEEEEQKSLWSSVITGSDLFVRAP